MNTASRRTRRRGSSTRSPASRRAGSSAASSSTAPCSPMNVTLRPTGANRPRFRSPARAGRRGQCRGRLGQLAWRSLSKSASRCSKGVLRPESSTHLRPSGRPRSADDREEPSA
ncbi:MAG: hypothetical protein ACK53Y_17455 [bacterium]